MTTHDAKPKEPPRNPRRERFGLLVAPLATYKRSEVWELWKMLETEHAEMLEALKRLLDTPDLNLESMDDETLEAITHAQTVIARAEGTAK